MDSPENAESPPEIVQMPRPTRRYPRRIAIGTGFVGVVILVFWLLPNMLNPTPPTPEEKKRDQKWVSTSPYWLDRQACQWFGLCGLQHLRWDAPELPGALLGNGSDRDSELRRLELRSLPFDDTDRQWLKRESLGQESWEIASRQQAANAAQKRRVRDATSADARAIPDYVLAYAPMVHLYSGEHFWPSHIAEHVRHMTAFANGTPVAQPSPVTLDNMSQLNGLADDVYLTSNDDVESRPEWLHSHANIPVPFDDVDDDASEDEREPSFDDPDDTPGRQFIDDTTWFSVDKDHPLRRISDPRKLIDLDPRPRRSGGPFDTRTRRLRKEDLKALSADTLGAMAKEHILGGGTHKAQTVLMPQGHEPDTSGYSKAPAILVMVDKGSGILDAFWFFFYSYNLGQTVLGTRYGNHVGDWEHCMIRFESGVPRALFLSEHEGGQAYAWSALEKMQPRSDNGTELPLRPVVYSAVGSHAMYAVPGRHPYVLPFNMLKDDTDRGPLWDPALNNLAYFYDYTADDSKVDSDKAPHDGQPREEPTSLTPASANPEAPTSWFHYTGRWGDELYPLGDKRQWRLFGQYHYITGPKGPKFKNLQREKVCQTARCRLLYHLDDSGTWY